VLPATSRRVQRAAQRAGYEPNPLVRSVMAAVRRSSQQTFQGALLAINHSKAEKPEQSRYHREVFAGAQRRAVDLGYSMELCWLGSRGLSLARLGTIIRARNVQGLVVLPFVETLDFSALKWSSLAGVMMDYCLCAPALTTVLPDHHLAVRRALELLEQRGYTRPGLAVADLRDRRVFHKWFAGFASHFRRTRQPVPPMQADVITRAGFLRWFRAYRPDVLLGHHQEEMVRWLGEEGLVVPRDVGFVQLNWTERCAPSAGLNQQPKLLGAAAVESVVAQLQRNESGVSENPKTIMLASRWVDGPTLRPAPAG